MVTVETEILKACYDDFAQPFSYPGCVKASRLLCTLTPMIRLLRLSALGVSLSLLIMLIPVLMLGLAFPGEEVLSIMEQVIFMVGVPLSLISGFIFIFFYGERIIRSITMRLVGAALLSFPIAITTWPLLSGRLEFRFVAIPLLLFSVLMFSAFVFPAWLNLVNNQSQRTPTGAAEQQR